MTDAHRYLSGQWDNLEKAGLDPDVTERNIEHGERTVYALSEYLKATDEMLEESKADPRHPDRWVKESGPAAVEALAAKHTITFEHERARQAHETAVGEESPALERQPQRAVTESGYGF